MVKSKSARANPAVAPLRSLAGNGLAEDTGGCISGNRDAESSARQNMVGGYQVLDQMWIGRPGRRPDSWGRPLLRDFALSSCGLHGGRAQVT